MSGGIEVGRGISEAIAVGKIPGSYRRDLGSAGSPLVNNKSVIAALAIGSKDINNPSPVSVTINKEASWFLNQPEKMAKQGVGSPAEKKDSISSPIFNPSEDELKAKFQELFNQRKPLDYATIFDGVKVAYFADWHDFRGIILHLIQNMPEFKRLGVTHLFLEAFSGDEQTQTKLNRYIQAQNESEIEGLEKLLLSHLKQEWKHAPELLLELVRVAKKEGINIFGLRLKQETSTDDWIRLSNQRWATIIGTELNRPGAGKGIVFGGGGHFDDVYGAIFGGILPVDKLVQANRVGAASLLGRVVICCTQTDILRFSKDYTPNPIYPQTIEQFMLLFKQRDLASLGDSFMLLDVRLGGFSGADAVIYIPGKTKTTSTVSPTKEPASSPVAKPGAALPTCPRARRWGQRRSLRHWGYLVADTIGRNHKSQYPNHKQIPNPKSKPKRRTQAHCGS